LEQQLDQKEDDIIEQVFAFEECVTLNDGQYHVDYCIKSNSQEKIDYLLSLSPKISVEKYSPELMQENQANNLLNTDNTLEENENVDFIESISGGNIPHGYVLNFSFDKKDENIVETRSYNNYYFTNTGAYGIYVAEGGHQLVCHFYSRGCCWYSVGWYDRGYRTIGPYNTISHSFYTSPYTSYSGARMKSYTTLTAWNATTKQFLY
jgi:hypothetical protein